MMGNYTSKTVSQNTKHIQIDWQQTYLNDFNYIDKDNFGCKTYTIQGDKYLVKTFTDLLDQGNLDYEFVEEPSTTPTNLLEDMMRYMNNPLAYYDPSANMIRSLDE